MKLFEDEQSKLRQEAFVINLAVGFVGTGNALAAQSLWALRIRQDMEKNCCGCSSHIEHFSSPEHLISPFLGGSKFKVVPAPSEEMDQMPSEVSFQPKLFYDSVMKDTFPADCMSSFWAALVENTRGKNPKMPSQFNLIRCILHFLGSTEKAER